MTAKSYRALLGAGLLALLALSPLGAAAQDDEIVFGTSAVLGGPIAQAGGAVVDGYKFAIDEINAAGGVTVKGKPYKIRLAVLDNAGDPNLVSGQARKLVLEEHAVALLGAVAPPFNGALSASADQLKVPLAACCLPIVAWQAGRPEGYKYAWIVYAYEPEAAAATWQSMQGFDTNKKAAVFANTNDDGDAWAKFWTETAPKYGFEVVYTAKMPIGTTNFSEYIAAAKASGADIVLGQMVPGDGIAAWKQMKALGYTPKVVTCELCGAADSWPQALGPLAEGTMTTDIWKAGMGNEATERVIKALGPKYAGKVFSLTLAAHSTVNLLVDAIKRADSLEADAINAEIGNTDALYAVGQVKFTLGHAAPLASVMSQWQGGKLLGVWPADSDLNAKPEFPVPGLQ